ncbi:MAG: sodium:solute symporter family protein [Sedimentisphaerales bacterium]|nr:sodium:solute symporter family protein [Sedimentisphaerales bacterium]
MFGGHAMLAAVKMSEVIVVIVYLMVVGYLGFLGFRGTKSETDYLVAGRKTHPFIMALSYGATFISTSAIVGFGGVAGMFGMSLLWLTFLNIFVGIFIAFVVFGGPTRRMGHQLDAHTFPELLGRRYGNSMFIQVFSGLVIFLFIPLYAAAVLIGGCEFISSQFSIDYDVALLVFSILIAAYVVVGGLKGVMYTDALQGSIMFIGMIILLIWSYAAVGGITAGHQALTDLGQGPNIFGGIGFKGWTAMPEFGWGVAMKADGVTPNPDGYSLWWIVVSTITLGVGIGVLAQPQLAVRFMTVKSKRELNRAVLVGGIFILIMTGVAFTVGSLSNLFFHDKDFVAGRLVDVSGNGSTPAEFEWVIAKEERDINVGPDGALLNPAVDNTDLKCVPCIVLHIDTADDEAADTFLIYRGHGGVAAIMPRAEIGVLADGVVPGEAQQTDVQAWLADDGDIMSLIGQNVGVLPRATAFTRAVIQKGDYFAFNTGSIIPTYIKAAMPGWFGLIFLLTLLAAAMSTLSSQFHAVGTSIGRDVYEQVTGKHGKSIVITRVGIIVGIILAVLISHYARVGYIIARATAIFFGLCASAFLPAFVGGLFSKRVTPAAAKASIVVGFIVSAFWLLFIKDQEARALGVCKFLFDKHSLLLGHPSWPVVDPIVVALPLSILTFIVVTLLTKPCSEEHLAKCFKK